MKRILAALLAAALLPLLGGCTLPWQKPAAPAENTAAQEQVQEFSLDNEPAALLTGVETDKRVVSLIFEGYSDDESMEAIVSLMSRRRVDCVFFVSGMAAAEHPEQVRAISSAGLTIGSYGMTGQKDMQENSVENNLRQLVRAQEVLSQTCGVTPSLLRCNGTLYTREMLQIAAAAGHSAAVLPTVYLNHRSFSGEDAALNFVQRLVRGSIISVKLGQELDADEYGTVIAIHEMRPMNDPEPSIARAQDDIPRSVYADLSVSLEWLLDALEEEGFSIVSPEALQTHRVQLLDEPMALTEEDLALMDTTQYMFPVTREPLQAGSTRRGTLRDLEGSVFVGDTVMDGLSGYVQWNLAGQGTEGDAAANGTSLGGLRFLTASNLGVEGALTRVTATSVHPLYEGRKTSVEDALRDMNPKRVYLMLMCKDYRAYEGSGTLSSMKLLLHLIRKSCPNAEIVLLSYPPNCSTLSTATSNTLIFHYNLRLYGLCRQYGFTFIDVASALRDDQGRLNQRYCLDPLTYGTNLSSAGCEAFLSYLTEHIPE